MSYSDLLRDPRWQRKRLERMQASDWQCDRCGSGTRMLTVHHLKYVPGSLPWEYDTDELSCLCDPCHKENHGLRETDPEFLFVVSMMKLAHDCENWDEMYKLAKMGEDLISRGFFYRGLV